jgi:hypothetical protein
VKLIGAAFGIAALFAVGAAAQTQTTHREGDEKIKVEDGKKITISGCLARNPGGGYMLTDEAGDMKYALVTDKDLHEQLGHRVDVRGKATDRGDAKVKFESKVGTAGTTDDREHGTDAKTEFKGDLGLHYLGVDSVKTISKSCR